MARVRFPLLVRKTCNGTGYTLFAREEENWFDWVEDQLEATVYTSSREFKGFWDRTATQLMKDHRLVYDMLRNDHWRWELVYVGQ